VVYACLYPRMICERGKREEEERGILACEMRFARKDVLAPCK